MILSKMDSSDIGLKLFNSWVDPPLWIVITFATFKTSGKIPVEKDALIIWQRGVMIRSATIFKCFRGILAGPVALLGNAFMTSKISSPEINVMISSNWLRFLRNFSGEMLGTFGTVFSVSGPTLTKKLLNLFVIVPGSVSILPWMLSWEIENPYTQPLLLLL